MAYHKKTGNFYKVIGTAIDATNGRENDEKMVIYERCGKLFVRKISEFKEKFNWSKSDFPGECVNAERGNK